MTNTTFLRRVSGRAAVFALASLLLGPGFSAEIVEVQVERDDDAFHVYFEILINAPAGKVRDVLSDYDHLEDLSPGVLSSEILSGTAGGEATVAIALRPCVWVLCRTVRKVSRVSTNAYGAIIYDVVPESSDFEYGREQLIISHGAASGQTRVTYNAKMVPKFFVPPLLGRWLIRRNIAQNLEISTPRVEQRALN